MEPLVILILLALLIGISIDHPSAAQTGDGVGRNQWV
jgi:hypothetical protein